MTVSQDTINGRARGRAVPSLPTHTFKDSGITVRLHKLSPLTSQEIIATVRRELKGTEPQPPLAEVDYGNGKVTEPNKLHPVYVEQLKEWTNKVNAEVNERLFRIACLIAVECDINDTWREYVKQRRRLLRIAGKIDIVDDPELTQDENDQIFYVSHIACASPEDMQEFYMAIIARSQPTEAAVELHKDSFPGDVPGPVDLEL